MGDFGIVVVPRDGADTERIMNHSSILRKYKVREQCPCSHLVPRALTSISTLYVRQMSSSLSLLISVCSSWFQDNIIVVKDAMSHPMSIVSSTKSR